MVGAVCNLLAALFTLVASGWGAYLLIIVGGPLFWVAVCATIGSAFWVVAAVIDVKEASS
jgi:hypothetical protein